MEDPRDHVGIRKSVFLDEEVSPGGGGGLHDMEGYAKASIVDPFAI